MTRVAITKDNVSPLLEIFIWFCLVVSLITVLVRFVTKRYILHRIDLDDYSIAISLVWILRLSAGFDYDLADPFQLCASAQSFTISLATSNGLGKHIHSLDTHQLSALFKAS